MSRLRRGRTICLTSLLDFLRGCVSGLRALKGKLPPALDVPGGKRLKRFSPDEVAQKSLIIITVDSPKRASDALMNLEGAS